MLFVHVQKSEERAKAKQKKEVHNQFVFRVMPVVLPLIVVCSLGILSSWIKVSWNVRSPRPRIARIDVNGNVVHFTADPNQPYPHYDLAIDFCAKHGESLGYRVDDIKDCIFPLMRTLEQGLQPIGIQSKQRSSSLKSDWLVCRLRNWMSRIPAMQLLGNRLKLPPCTQERDDGKSVIEDKATITSLSLIPRFNDASLSSITTVAINDSDIAARTEHLGSAPFNLSVSTANIDLPDQSLILPNSEEHSSVTDSVGEDIRYQQPSDAGDTQKVDADVQISNKNLVNYSENDPTISHSQIVQDEIALFLVINQIHYSFYLPVKLPNASLAIAKLASEFCQLHGSALLQDFIEANSELHDNTSIEYVEMIGHRCEKPVEKALIHELITTHPEIKI